MTPLLSICIPTFNRKEWIRRCLWAILRQVEGLPAGAIEIVVSDNASTDGTRAYLDFAAGPGIVIHHNESNNYLTNFWTVCQHATGDYCWLMGDDDEPSPGAIGRVLEALASGADWYFPETLLIEHASRSKTEINLYDQLGPWDLRNDFTGWAGSVQTEAGAGGLLSVLIGRRQALLAGFASTERWGNDTKFPHLAAFLDSAFSWPKLAVIPGNTVVFREYNDSTGKADPWQRIKTDLDAWLMLGERILDPGHRAAFNGILKRHHGCRTIPTMWMLRDEAHPWEEAKRAYIALGYHPDALETAESFLVTRQRVAPQASVTYNGGTGNAAHHVASQTLAKLGVNR